MCLLETSRTGIGGRGSGVTPFSSSLLWLLSCLSCLNCVYFAFRLPIFLPVVLLACTWYTVGIGHVHSLSYFVLTLFVNNLTFFPKNLLFLRLGWMGDAASVMPHFVFLIANHGEEVGNLNLGSQSCLVSLLQLQRYRTLLHPCGPFLWLARGSARVWSRAGTRQEAWQTA